MKRKLLAILGFLALSLIVSSCFVEFDSMANRQPPFTNQEGELFTSSTPLRGTANGFGGPITVTLVIMDGYIEFAVIDAPRETPAYAGPAVIARAAEIMMSTNNVDVLDAISGATFTATGIRQAAVRALNTEGLVPPHLAGFID